MKKILIFLLIFLLSGCANQSTPLSETKMLLNTVITISLYDHKEQSVLDGCFEMIKKYENLFSVTIGSSEIAKINASHGAKVIVSPDTADIITKGIYYGDLSNGGFDITIGALSDLWGFKTDNKRVPLNAEIEAALQKVNYNDIVVEGNTVRLKNPEMQIDLGGIAKGYIADKLTAYLKEKGVASAIINLGGNVYVIGSKTKNEQFKIGIKDPIDPDKICGVVEVKDKTVVTSGVYERFFEENGKKYHHILSTKTGLPTESDLLSVTIICENSTEADALSTICLILGKNEAEKLINSIPNTHAIFIDINKKVTTTDLSKSNIKFTISE